MFEYYHIITVITSLIVHWYFLLRFVAHYFTCDCTEDLRGKKGGWKGCTREKNPIDWNLVGVYGKSNAMCNIWECKRPKLAIAIFLLLKNDFSYQWEIA